MSFQIKYFWKYAFKLLPYLKVTFAYVLGALVFGIIFGAILAYFKIGKNKLLKRIGIVYTAIFRSIPPVVLLFLVYYGLPQILNTTGNNNQLLYVIVTLSLLSTASISEVIRSAYNSVPRGQYEAAVTSGLTPFQSLREIVLPQAFFYALPNFASTIISLLKDGSLAFTIGLLDIFGKAMTLNNSTYSKYVLEIYLAVTLVYWGSSFLIERFFKILEINFSVKKHVSGKRFEQNQKGARTNEF